MQGHKDSPHRLLQLLAKKQEAYLVHQAEDREEGNKSESSVKHFPKWCVYC